MSQGTNQPAISPDKVVQRLCSSELGLALWRAAVAEETVEIYRERVEQLETQKAPDRGMTDPG